MAEVSWGPSNTAPEGIPVWTMVSDHFGMRNAAVLIRSGRLWFIPGEGVYVYYTPTHWAPLTRPQTVG